MKTLAIIGSGDLGQQIANYAISDGHYTSVVFFDDFSSQTQINDHKILGKTTDVVSAFQNKLFDELIIGIGYKHLQIRSELFEKFSNEIPFGIIIHSSSWVDPSAKINKGCVIYPCNQIDANVIIKENTILNIGCTVAHDTEIGQHCFLSPRVAIAGFVKIKKMCILGINSIIIDNIVVAENVQIGGGGVVIKTIENKGLYVGNPVKFIR